MSRIIEAKAVISAEDRASATLGKIGKAFDQLAKGAKSAARVDELSKALTRVREQGAAIDRFRFAQDAFGKARANFRAAQADVERYAKELDQARKVAAQFDKIAATSKGGLLKGGALAQEAAAARAKVLELEGAFGSAQRAVRGASTAFEQQKSAILGAKHALEGFGIPINRIAAEEKRLQGIIQRTNAEMKTRDDIARRGAKAGIVAPHLPRAAAAGAALAAGARAGNGEPDLGHAAVGVGAGAAAKRVYEKARDGWVEMDEATRRQRAILSIAPDAQKPLQEQALKIGQDTRFSNPDVVKAQTRIGSSLPDHLKNPEVIKAITENSKNYALAMGTTMDQASEAVLGRMLGMRYDMSTPEAAGKSSLHAANRLVQFAKSSGADHNDVMGYTKFGAAPGSVGGFSEEFQDAMAAQLRRIGYEGSMGGNFVRAAATKLAVPTQKGLGALAASGFTHDDYVAPGKKLNVDNLEKVVAQRYGKKLTSDQRTRIAALFDDEDVVGKREEFVPKVSDILQETLARRTKKGAVNASDAESISKAVNGFLSTSAGAVDIERLMRDVIAKGITPALAKYLFGQEHGGRAQALDAGTLDKDQASFKNTPTNRAQQVGDEIQAGAYGAYQRMIGSIETFYMRLGQVNDGPLTTFYDKVGNAVDGISKLPDGVLQFGTAIAGATAALLALKGAAAVGSMLGVPGAAATGAALGTAGTVAARFLPTFTRGAGVAGMAYLGAGALDAASTKGGEIMAAAHRDVGVFPDETEGTTRLAEYREELARVATEIEQVRSKSKLPEAADLLAAPLESKKAALENNIKAVELGLQKLRSSAGARFPVLPPVPDVTLAPELDAPQVPLPPPRPNRRVVPDVPLPPARPVEPAPDARASPAPPAPTVLPPTAPVPGPLEISSLDAQREKVAALKTELEGLKTAMTSIGASAGDAAPMALAPLQQRATEVEAEITKIEAALQQLSGVTASPTVDTASIDAASTKATEAGSTITSALNVTASPKVETGSIDAAIAKVNELNAALSAAGARADQTAQRVQSAASRARATSFAHYEGGRQKSNA